MVSPDGCYVLKGCTLVVKIVDSFDWANARQLWSKWNRIGSRIATITGDRLDYIFLMFCMRAKPTAALWIDYVCHMYSPSVKGYVVLVDLDQLRAYVSWRRFNNRLEMLTPILIGGLLLEQLFDDSRIKSLKTNPRPYWRIVRISNSYDTFNVWSLCCFPFDRTIGRSWP